MTTFKGCLLLIAATAAIVTVGMIFGHSVPVHAALALACLAVMPAVEKLLP